MAFTNITLTGTFTDPDGGAARGWLQLTPVDGLCLVAATPIRDGRFTVRCSGPDGTRVAWLVKAIRADVPLFDPEPLRADVDVRGTGPYRYIQPRTG